MLDKNSNSSYTISVDRIVNGISGNEDETPSLYQQAAQYFKQEPLNKQKLQLIKTEMQQVISAKKAQSSQKASKLDEQLLFLKRKYNHELLVQKSARLARLNDAVDMCLNLLSLSEGNDFDDTQLKSAKFLSTLVLFSPGKGKKLAALHHKLKPAYKAVLSLRVLDKLVIDGVVKNAYMMKHYDPKKRYEPEASDYICYTQSVILPIMLAAIFQDVGLQHPDLVELLEGEEGEKDRFRLLEKHEREKMLRLNYDYTIDYLQNGLGCQQASSSTAQQQVEFDESEKQRLKFQLGLVLDANNAKQGTSEILKIPQIYASIIFSTKHDFQRKSYPTASILIEQLAIKKVISKQIAKVFVDIVGHFPLGYGIVYIPRDIRGNELEIYEYAIVTELNPKVLDEPVCRPVTKNLMFLTSGKTLAVDKNLNLHFPVARKKLVKIDPKRLIEIMEKLTYDFKPEQSAAFVPDYWEPHNYFCVAGNQNLWNRSG
ncbi:MAG: hypothetical protein ABJK37_05105 [Paraglaciecola sp.]|uniref:hypothetical protein n=1 Tax=Paraglaciecola sp. TaxID=1920173 RepID=UPI003297E75A